MKRFPMATLDLAWVIPGRRCCKLFAGNRLQCCSKPTNTCGCPAVNNVHVGGTRLRVENAQRKWTLQVGPPQLHDCCFADSSKEIGYNGICLTAYTHGILMGDTPKNGRAWRAHFSSDVRPIQGTILLHF